MKRKINLFLMLLLVLSLSSCKDKEDFSYNGMIAPYFHEATFTNYEEDVDLSTLAGLANAGCSSVRNGDYVGRNFDYLYNDCPTFLIRVNKTKDHYASIGIGQNWSLSESDVVNKTNNYLDKIALLPNLTLDGVNENGVYINDNVVTLEEGQSLTGTKPSASKKLHILMIPRFILDHAKSADHAIELLQSINIYGSFGHVGQEHLLHYMIADLNKTYIVEFWNNELVIEEKTGDKQIMTNYNLNIKNNDEYIINEHPQGLERYEILKENYNTGNSIAGMYNLMQKVRFSNLYYTLDSRPMYSDSALYTYTQLKNFDDTDKEYFYNGMKEDMIRYDHVLATQDRKGLTNDGVVKDWITIHNSTYDIRNKTLMVSVQEDYLHTYSFSL